jgi:hypothetical protein
LNGALGAVRFEAIPELAGNASSGQANTITVGAAGDRKHSRLVFD